MDAATGATRPLPSAGIPAGSSVVGVAWAPDGGRLALATSTGLYVVRTGRARRIGPRRAVAGVDWSPDGRELVFASARPDAPRTIHGPTTDVFRVRSDGTRLSRLTASRGFDLAPSWRP